MPRIGKPIKPESRSVVARTWGRGRGRRSYGYEIFFWDNENILDLNSGDVAKLCEYGENSYML